jgi:hypothetical protein
MVGTYASRFSTTKQDARNFIGSNSSQANTAMSLWRFAASD